MTLPYDDASRLTSAAYSEGNNNYNRYGAQYTYDCMGNMTSLKRNGLQDGGTYGLIDDLSFCYDGNRLMSVSDAVTDPTYNNAWNFKDGADSDSEYEYDENGNVTKDLNKNISSIQYNSLNLPTQILFADGNAIRYMYSADGRKLRAEYTTAMPATTKTIDYCGNLIFENGTLKQILVEGGYIMMDDWSHPYCFYIKDHLGNNRMVVNQRGTVDQVNNYYPYGGLMANSTGWNAQRYKYNGKELDRMHGLDWYDYGARWQDAAIGGRWHAMDPLCEKYYDISPYVYCESNPINAIDPDGRSGWKVLLKAAYRVGKTTIKHGGKSLTKAATYADAFNDIVEDTKNVFDNKVSTYDRLAAGFSLASEFLPISVKDVKDAKKYLESSIRNTSRKTQRKSINQLQQEVEKGKAPNEIKRFDKGNPDHKEQDHVHFKNNTALNKDGTMKHGEKLDVSKKTKKYLEKNGFKTSQE